jgi:hypothetical protein
MGIAASLAEAGPVLVLLLPVPDGVRRHKPEKFYGAGW